MCKHAYGWNLPGGTSLLAECHQTMLTEELLPVSIFHGIARVLLHLSNKRQRGSVPSVVEKIDEKVSGKNLNLTFKMGNFCFKIFHKSQKDRLCEANYAP